MAFALRLIFLVGLPLEESHEPYSLSAFNDEQAHYDYVVHIAEVNTRPIQSHSILESYPQGLHDYEYYQPPLWYRIAGSMFNLIPESQRGVYAVRFLNLILSLLLILTVGRVVSIVSPRYGFSSMLFLAVLGSAVFFGATATNDVLLWLLSALTVYYGLLLIHKPEWKKRLAVTLCLSAAIWTKLSALTLLPAVFYVLFITFKGERIWLKAAFTLGWLAFAFLWTIPLFRENYIYYGSILPLSVGLGPPQNIAASLSLGKFFQTANYLVHSFYFPFENYWRGAFQAVLFLFLGVSTLALAYLSVKGWVKEFTSLSGENNRGVIFFGLTLLAAIVGVLMMVVRYNQSEARLAFVALPAICLLIISGMDRILGKFNRNLRWLALIFPALPYILFVIF